MISGAIAILNANTTLTTALGDEKIHAVVVPEGVAPPYLAVGLLSDPSDPVKGGDRTGFPTFYVNVHADDYDEIETLTDLVKDAFHQASYSSAYAGWNISKVWCSNAIDRPDLYKPEGNINARTIQFNSIIKR